MTTIPALDTGPLWTGTIPAEPASKANSRRLVFNGGKPRFIKSAKGLSFMEVASCAVKAPSAPITGDVMLVATLFYRTRRPDLDESLVMDALEKCGVIANDRQVKQKHVYWALDRDKPRAEIEIWPCPATGEA